MLLLVNPYQLIQYSNLNLISFDLDGLIIYDTNTHIAYNIPKIR